MAIVINEQYTKFVQFAEQQMNAGNGKAIARDGGAAAEGNPLAGHNITAATGDKVAPLWRSTVNKTANDNTRTLFRNAILDMFGGNEADIPASVKTAMRLVDYDKGKPLTARRIMAVKAAVDQVVSDKVAYNQGVVDNVVQRNFNALPQEFQNALNELVSELRAVFGEAAVPQGAVISDIFRPSFMQGQLKAIRDAANAQGRELTVQEIKATYASAAFERLACNAVGAHILQKIKERQPDFGATGLSVGTQFKMRHPAFIGDFGLCKSPNDIAGLFANYQADIDAFVDLASRSHAAYKDVPAKVGAKLAKLASGQGIDESLFLAHVNTAKLVSAAKDLGSAILNGTAPGSKEHGYNVEAAYGELVDKFVKERADAFAAIDQLDLPEDVKNFWKAEYVAHKDMPVLTPAQMFEASKSIDVDKLLGAFDKGLPIGDALEKMKDVANKFLEDCKEASGNPNVLVGLGADAMPLYSMLIMVAEAKNPDLAKAVQKANSFFNKAVKDCQDKARADRSYSEAAAFIEVLRSRGGTERSTPVMDEKKFLALVGDTVESSCAGCGIADGEVRNAIKERMLERGGNLIRRANGLKRLSEFIAKIKADVAAIPAKQDEVVAKYSADLSKETVPLLKRLAGVLDWSGKSAEASENIVKNYVEDMKTWRNVAPGSLDAQGLESVFQRRMTDYLKYALTQDKNFNKDKHAGLSQDFLNDLSRSAVYTVNGTRLEGASLDERLVHFMGSIKDAGKRKAVSMMINQQIFGEFTTSIANRVPLAGWKEGMKDELPSAIPGIEKFASRDIMKTFDQLFGAGPMSFSIEVSPDESTVTVHATCDYPIHADVSLKAVSIGTCKVTQDFVIDLSGEEPSIRDFKIGQTFE